MNTYQGGGTSQEKIIAIKRHFASLIFGILFLVLLKETGKQSDFKILSCCFCVWCKSRELEGRGSPRFPFITPVVGRFS